MRVTTIDLSAASIAHGIRKAAECQVNNLSFLRGDILDLPALGRRFDHIECVGVIHHIRDHERAWRELAAVLESGGTLRAAVYGKAARLAVTRLRSIIAAEGLTNSDHDVRRLRQRLAEPSLGGWLRADALDDLATLGMTRDLLFHPWEHHFTLTEIERIATSLGLALLSAVVPRELRTAYLHCTGTALAPVRTFERWRDLEWAYAGSLAMFEGWFQRA